MLYNVYKHQFLNTHTLIFIITSLWIAAKYWHNLRPSMSLLVDGTTIENVTYPHSASIRLTKPKSTDGKEMNPDSGDAENKPKPTIATVELPANCTKNAGDLKKVEIEKQKEISNKKKAESMSDDVNDQKSSQDTPGTDLEVTVTDTKESGYGSADVTEENTDGKTSLESSKEDIVDDGMVHSANDIDANSKCDVDKTEHGIVGDDEIGNNARENQTCMVDSNSEEIAKTDANEVENESATVDDSIDKESEGSDTHKVGQEGEAEENLDEDKGGADENSTEAEDDDARDTETGSKEGPDEDLDESGESEAGSEDSERTDETEGSFTLSCVDFVPGMQYDFLSCIFARLLQVLHPIHFLFLLNDVFVQCFMCFVFCFICW